MSAPSLYESTLGLQVFPECTLPHILTELSTHNNDVDKQRERTNSHKQMTRIGLVLPSSKV
eukprot:jgi/Botrbrau1/6016/Bobra.0042s0002.1